MAWGMMTRSFGDWGKLGRQERGVGSFAQHSLEFVQDFSVSCPMGRILELDLEVPVQVVG